MNIIIDDVATYLANEELGYSAGVNLFVGHQPNSPTNCITIIDTGGMKPPIDFNSKKPTFQVLIRNSDYATGRALLDSVRTALHNLYGVELVTGSNFFHSINAMSEGGHIGRDEKGNDEFSINFQAYIR